MLDDLFDGEDLAEAGRVWRYACVVWGSEEEAKASLFRPHPMLENHRPADIVLGSEVGAQLVEGILGRLRFGSAA